MVVGDTCWRQRYIPFKHNNCDADNLSQFWRSGSDDFYSFLSCLQWSNIANNCKLIIYNNVSHGYRYIGAPSGGWESRRIINHIYSNILLNSITKYVKPFYPSSHNRKFDRNYIPFVYFTKKPTLTFHRSQPGFQAVCSTSPMVLQSSRVQHRDTV